MVKLLESVELEAGRVRQGENHNQSKQQMASLINIDGERDIEQGLVKLDEEKQIGVLETDVQKREPFIAQLDNAFIGIARFALYMAILSIIFVLMSLTDSDKDREPIAYWVFLAASFSSILVGIIIRFGRAVHRNRIGQAIPAKRLKLIGNVLLWASEGFFMVSIFAAVFLLVSFQLKWVVIYVALAIWATPVLVAVIVYTTFERRIGFVGVSMSISVILAFRIGGIMAVWFYSHI